MPKENQFRLIAGVLLVMVSVFGTIFGLLLKNVQPPNVYLLFVFLVGVAYILSHTLMTQSPRVATWFGRVAAGIVASLVLFSFADWLFFEQDARISTMFFAAIVFCAVVHDAITIGYESGTGLLTSRYGRLAQAYLYFNSSSVWAMLKIAFFVFIAISLIDFRKPTD